MTTFRTAAIGRVVSVLVPLAGLAAADEEYDIYTEVLAHPKFSHADENRIYLIIGTTGPAAWLSDPRTCIGVPDAYKQRFREILAGVERHKDERNRLRRALRIERPYELLSEAEAREFFRHDRSRFPGAIDVITLSNVFFSRDHTLALTAMSSVCGSLCGYASWRIFEKTADGKWRERDWVQCFTVAYSPSLMPHSP